MSMRAYLVPAVLIVSSLTLAACGQSPGCRALTGGAIGAAGGAALGAIGGNPGLGALAGGAAGAATGGLTSPDAVSAGPSPVCN
jgi:osmotically inducible lipoprotein OsmB